MIPLPLSHPFHCPRHARAASRGRCMLVCNGSMCGCMQGLAGWLGGGFDCQLEPGILETRGLAFRPTPPTHTFLGACMAILPHPSFPFNRPTPAPMRPLSPPHTHTHHRVLPTTPASRSWTLSPHTHLACPTPTAPTHPPCTHTHTHIRHTHAHVYAHTHTHMLVVSWSAENVIYEAHTHVHTRVHTQKHMRARGRTCAS